MDFKMFMEEFGKAFVPEKIFNFEIRVNLHRYLLSAGIQKVPYMFFGILFWISIGLTYLIFMPLIYPSISGQSIFAVFLFSFISWVLVQAFLLLVFILGLYLYLNVKIFKRTSVIESMLPDFLVLVSTNLKGGLSLEQSLWASIRPDFGLLSEEMTLVSKRVMTGNDLSEALNEFSIKYQAPNLQRNLQLIIGEVKSGGRIVKVIDKVIDSLKRTKSMKNEMAAATVSYIIFIGAIVVVISPALFALAFQLMNIIIGFTSTLGGSLSSTSMGAGFNFDAQVDTGNFKKFSIMALTTISIGASMIISIIEKGDIRNGLKYIPLFSIGAVSFYLIFMVVLSAIFGGMI